MLSTGSRTTLPEYIPKITSRAMLPGKWGWTMKESTTWPKATREHPCPKCGKANRCLIAPDGGAGICWRSGTKEVWRDNASGNGNGNGFDNGYVGAAHRPKPKPKAGGTIKAFITAQAAIDTAGRMIGGTFVAGWTYCDAGGLEVLRVVRFALADGEKEYRPIHPAKDGWRIGDPSGLLPIYRLNEVTAAGTVWVTEGEKAADAAHKIGLMATTSAHGAGSAEKSDWTPLAGRQVCILPDHDEQGRKYANDVARLLVKLSPPATVKIVTLPGLPERGDVVEYIGARDSMESEAIAQSIAVLVDATPFINRSDVLGGAVLRCLADIEPESIAWLWPGRYALGKLSLIGGVPGVGKSWLSLYIAAAISRGFDWPDGRGQSPLGSVIIANAEDGAADTIKPRLMAMDADCRRIHVLDCIKRQTEDGMVESGFTMADVSALEEEIKRLGDCKAVVIDPVSAYLAGTDEYKNGEVRALLKPLMKMAERHGVAILCVTHLTKGGGTNSVHRMIGSIGFAGAARSVWMIAKDPKNPERRLMLLSKCNIAADEGGLAYSIVNGTIAFEPGTIDQSADDVLAEEQQGESGPGRPAAERNEAEEWLRQKLADFAEHPVSDLQKASDAAGIHWRTVERAKKDLGVIYRRAVFGGGYVWRLPKPGKPDDDARPCSPQSLCVNSGEHGEHDEKPGKTANCDPLESHARQNSHTGEQEAEVDEYEAVERAALQQEGM